MQIEKKLIVGCILALAVGSLAVSPLLFSMFETTRAEINSPPHFGIDIPYAYIRFTTNSTTDEFSRQHVISLNYTNYVGSDNSLPDAAIEYFLLQIYSDKGAVVNFTEYVGTAYNNSFTPQTFNSFIFNRDNWLDTRTLSKGEGGGGIFFFNWTEGTSHKSGTSGKYSASRLPNFQEPDTLFMNITRIASIIFKGNTTVVSIPNTLVMHIQFEKYQGGFLYNTIVPADDLAQMDPMKPKFGSSSG